MAVRVAQALEVRGVRDGVGALDRSVLDPSPAVGSDRGWECEVEAEVGRETAQAGHSQWYGDAGPAEGAWPRMPWTLALERLGADFVFQQPAADPFVGVEWADLDRPRACAPSGRIAA